MQSFSTFIGGFIVGFLKNWRLALVIVATAPLLAGIGIFFGKLMAAMAREGQEAFGKSIGLVSIIFPCLFVGFYFSNFEISFPSLCFFVIIYILYINEKATEALTAIRIVFAFNAESRECDRYNKAVDSGGFFCVIFLKFLKLLTFLVIVRDTRKRLTVSAVGIGIAIMIMFLVQALALYYGSTLLILGM